LPAWTLAFPEKPSLKKTLCATLSAACGALGERALPSNAPPSNGSLCVAKFFRPPHIPDPSGTIISLFAKISSP
ncbi:MAG: hypothetical protein LBU53_07305, partial [Zoogloeaceae bacterium]|nr:hypothetical protein [Zoogloeaceae bacterium]